MASSASDRTEKATPRRREEARKEGQVARSMEVASAFAMLGGFLLLLVWGDNVGERLGHDMKYWIARAANPGSVQESNMMEMFLHTLKVLAYTTGPFLGVMVLVGFVSNVIQIRFKVTPEALKPKLSRINPINGLKQKFSMSSLVELVKNVLKLLVVGIPAALSLWSHREELLALGSSTPGQAGLLAAKLVLLIGFQVAGIYVVIAILDYIWQRYQFEKSIRMTKQEVKQEARQQDIAPELKAAQRQRQREAARRRMLLDVPEADVIITNPTHYSIALRYDPDLGAPQVLAKGVDLLALRIREIADEAGIMRVENKPLARELYARVEVGQVIPGDMFAAVAEVLAYVYRLEQRTPGEAARRMQHA
jgi:flagellar biosynthetic protein FlhB